MPKCLLKIGISTAAAVILVLPGSAVAAETVIPPGNSAASQYTETFPTSGGNAELNGELDGSGLPPAKVLGEKTAKALAESGPEGRTVAELATEAAPEQSAVAGPSGSGGGSPPAGQERNVAPRGEQQPQSPQPQSQSQPQVTTTAGGGGTASIDGAAGSGGTGEVLGQLTGSSSGEMGLILPLLLLAGLVWAVAWSWRRHGQQATS